jgi:predicted DNA-binding protein YlxM (UPF0122 family)
MTYRKLAEKYNVSLGAVTNIMKRRDEYLSDYEDNQNKAASMIILVKNKVLFVFYHEKKI